MPAGRPSGPAGHDVAVDATVVERHRIVRAGDVSDGLQRCPDPCPTGDARAHDAALSPARSRNRSAPRRGVERDAPRHAHADELRRQRRGHGHRPAAAADAERDPQALPAPDRVPDVEDAEREPGLRAPLRRRAGPAHRLQRRPVERQHVDAARVVEPVDGRAGAIGGSEQRAPEQARPRHVVADLAQVPRVARVDQPHALLVEALRDQAAAARRSSAPSRPRAPTGRARRRTSPAGAAARPAPDPATSGAFPHRGSRCGSPPR